MKKVFYAMSAALSATALLVSSCTDENAAAPAFSLDKDTILTSETLNGTIVSEAFLEQVDLLGSTTQNGDKTTVTGFPKKDGTVGSGDFSALPIMRDANDKTKYTIVLKGSDIGAGYYRFTATDKNAKSTEKSFVVKSATITDPGDPNMPPTALTLADTIEGITLTNSWGTKDTINAVGYYFYKQGNSTGIFKVSELSNSSSPKTAKLTLYSVTGNTMTVVGTENASITSATDGSSYFTNKGAVKKGSELANDGSETFVGIFSGCLVVGKSGMPPSNGGNQITNAIMVSFLPYKNL